MLISKLQRLWLVDSTFGQSQASCFYAKLSYANQLLAL